MDSPPLCGRTIAERLRHGSGGAGMYVVYQSRHAKARKAAEAIADAAHHQGMIAFIGPISDVDPVAIVEADVLVAGCTTQVDTPFRWRRTIDDEGVDRSDSGSRWEAVRSLLHVQLLPSHVRRRHYEDRRGSRQSRARPRAERRQGGGVPGNPEPQTGPRRRGAGFQDSRTHLIENDPSRSQIGRTATQRPGFRRLRVWSATASCRSLRGPASN